MDRDAARVQHRARHLQAPQALRARTSPGRSRSRLPPALMPELSASTSSPACSAVGGSGTASMRPSAPTSRSGLSPKATITGRPRRRRGVQSVGVGPTAGWTDSWRNALPPERAHGHNRGRNEQELLRRQFNWHYVGRRNGSRSSACRHRRDRADRGPAPAAPDVPAAAGPRPKKRARPRRPSWPPRGRSRRPLAASPGRRPRPRLGRTGGTTTWAGRAWTSPAPAAREAWEQWRDDRVPARRRAGGRAEPRRVSCRASSAGAPRAAEDDGVGRGRRRRPRLGGRGRAAGAGGLGTATATASARPVGRATDAATTAQRRPRLVAHGRSSPRAGPRRRSPPPRRPTSPRLGHRGLRSDARARPHARARARRRVGSPITPHVGRGRAGAAAAAERRSGAAAAPLARAPGRCSSRSTPRPGIGLVVLASTALLGGSVAEPTPAAAQKPRPAPPRPASPRRSRTTRRGRRRPRPSRRPQSGDAAAAARRDFTRERAQRTRARATAAWPTRSPPRKRAAKQEGARRTPSDAGTAAGRRRRPTPTYTPPAAPTPRRRTTASRARAEVAQ